MKSQPKKMNLNRNLSNKITQNLHFKGQFRKPTRGIIQTLLSRETKYQLKIQVTKLEINLLTKIVLRKGSLRYRKKRKPLSSPQVQMDGEIKKNDLIYLKFNSI